MNKPSTRFFLEAKLILKSPLSIASGNDDIADSTCLRDYDGRPFIPGSSLAGALRDFALADSCLRDDVPLLFGYTDHSSSTQSSQSRLFISDCQSELELHSQIRDMVKLDHITKTAEPEGKFDIELVNEESVFILHIELVLYEEDDPSIISSFAGLIRAMESGYILLGAKKNRGFGRFTLKDICIERISLMQDGKADPDNAKRWIDFTWQTIVNNTCVQDLLPQNYQDKSFQQWKLPFKINDSLLIRTYQDFTEDDASMFVSNNVATIPGTSFAGCLKNACYNILHYDLEVPEPEHLLDQIFGFVDEDKKTAKQSQLIVKEIPLSKGHTASYTRNKVDRFTGAVADKALFTVKPIYEAEGTIELDFRSGTQDWIYGLIYLALRDISEGIAPIGGETSIGRGIFSISDQISFKTAWLDALSTITSALKKNKGESNVCFK